MCHSYKSSSYSNIYISIVKFVAKMTFQIIFFDAVTNINLIIITIIKLVKPFKINICFFFSGIQKSNRSRNSNIRFVFILCPLNYFNTIIMLPMINSIFVSGIGDTKSFFC